MSRLQTLVMTAVAVLIVSLTGTAAASPAPVAAAASCPANHMCLYEHDSFIGQQLAIPAGVGYANLRELPCAGCRSSKHSESNGTWEDMMSSWTNNTGMAYCWYGNINYDSLHPYPMQGGTAEVYVGRIQNDQASSIRPC